MQPIIGEEAGPTPQRGMYLLVRTSSVPAVVNSTAGTAYMSAQRLKLSVKSRMQEFPRDVTGRGANQSTLTATKGPDGKGRERMGKRTICLEDVLAWRCGQRRSRHRVQMLTLIHQWTCSSLENVRATPRWQEALAMHACIIHGRMNSGKYIRVDSSCKRPAAGVSGQIGAGGVNFRTSWRMPSSSV